MIFETLNESAARGELMLVENGFCHWHLRNDGQLTIREIISTRRGAGSLMLRRLESTIGATSLLAKCPVNLPANQWYTRKGFHVERMETTKTGRKLLNWRKPLATPKHLPTNAGGIQLFYCADGNPRFAQIAIDAGWYYGAQLPNKIHFKPAFVDQNWKAPSREKYMASLAVHRPYMATVLDWEQPEQFEDVMSWATEASRYAQTVVIIPKVPGGLHHIPDKIGGKPVRLGYSVPTSFGATPVQLAEFENRPVHLLGGSPNKQLELASVLNVVSADGNYAQKLSLTAQFWTPRLAVNGRVKYWPYLEEVDGFRHDDAPYEAFRRSCVNIIAAWRNLKIDNRDIPNAQLLLGLAI